MLSAARRAIDASRRAPIADHRRASIADARRALWIYTRDLDPGLFDAPGGAARRCAASPPPAAATSVRVLLQDAARPAARPRAAARAGAAPAQRLPVPRSRRSGRPRTTPRRIVANDPAAITSARSATASTARPTCTPGPRAAAARSIRGGLGTLAPGAANTARWASEPPADRIRSGCRAADARRL